MKITLLVLILIGGAAFAQDAPKSPSLKEVVSAVQHNYDTTKDMHAMFEQQTTSPNRKPRNFTGEVWLKKPGRMRWDYATPEKKLMVADGTTLWVYEPEDEQAAKQDIKNSTLPASVGVLMGEGKLADEFDASIAHAPQLVEKPGEVTLKLVPKKATAAYRHLFLVVDPKTGIVERTMVFDQQDGTNLIAFKNITRNGGVAEAKFHFSPPPGTKMLTP